MTYWGGLIFSDAANSLFVKSVQDWGKQNNLDIDVVMINQQETNQKVAAAVESGTMPDALDMGLDLLLLLSAQKKLEPLSSLDLSRSNTKLWEGRAMSAGRLSKKTVNIALVPYRLMPSLKV